MKMERLKFSLTRTYQQKIRKAKKMKLQATMMPAKKQAARRTLVVPVRGLVNPRMLPVVINIEISEI